MTYQDNITFAKIKSDRLLNAVVQKATTTSLSSRVSRVRRTDEGPVSGTKDVNTRDLSRKNRNEMRIDREAETEDEVEAEVQIELEKAEKSAGEKDSNSERRALISSLALSISDKEKLASNVKKRRGERKGRG